MDIVLKNLFPANLDGDKSHNHPIMIKATTFPYFQRDLNLRFSDRIMIDFYAECERAGFLAGNRFSPPPLFAPLRLAGTTFDSAGTRCGAVCAGCAACADVCGFACVCVAAAWPQNSLL